MVPDPVSQTALQRAKDHAAGQPPALRHDTDLSPLARCAPTNVMPPRPAGRMYAKAIRFPERADITRARRSDHSLYLADSRPSAISPEPLDITCA